MTLIPRNTTRLLTTLNLLSGSGPDVFVSNQAFLHSFLDVGVWLRCMTMHAHIAVLKDRQASRLQRFSASVGVYQQIGLAIEDTLATLVAWSIWARDNSVNLADIACRIVLRAGADGPEYGAHQLEVITSSLSSANKRVHLDARRYLRALVNGVPPRNLPGLFGVPWNKNPSVNLVPRTEMTAWNILPQSIAEHLRLITDKSSEFATANSNKLKHGPQLVVDRPRTAAQRYGHSELETKHLPDAELIRVLLAGPRTGLTEDQASGGRRVAPFLLDDAENATRLLHRGALDNANFMYSLGLYLYRYRFRDDSAPKPSTDAILTSLQAAHFDTL